MCGNCNHCCFCCGHPCTMLGVSLSISCKNKKKNKKKKKQDYKRLIKKSETNVRDYDYYDGSHLNVTFHLKIIPSNEGKSILTLNFSVTPNSLACE